ncbi:hypothetical protein BO71DRAFT_326160 [Aspergillus ellipticus CBS 707.79]|uniref:Uncharacterized protein n=1 Tax=Aspergillus ellipticus CBS 707.79 TaxID=1448320 RepID=A0A319ESX8_9EURO|nr:hypothetical protein BO71DRAFT_326160 [Aspergillus ellipticus CBS 707.79]
MQLSGLFVMAIALFASHIYAQSRPHGIDTGNVACVGACVGDPRDLPCSSPKWQAQLECYICCFENDLGGDFDDHREHDVLEGDLIPESA